MRENTEMWKMVCNGLQKWKDSINLDLWVVQDTHSSKSKTFLSYI